MKHKDPLLDSCGTPPSYFPFSIVSSASLFSFIHVVKSLTSGIIRLVVSRLNLISDLCMYSNILAVSSQPGKFITFIWLKVIWKYQKYYNKKTNGIDSPVWLNTFVKFSWNKIYLNTIIYGHKLFIFTRFSTYFVLYCSIPKVHRSPPLLPLHPWCLL